MTDSSFPSRGACGNSYSRILWFSALVLLFAASAWRQARPQTADSFIGPVINEFVAANKGGLADEDGEFSDWIEVFNPGNRAINLSGWALTDNADNPGKWMYPDLTLGAQQYLIVFASGKDRANLRPSPVLHANFDLDREGEYLALSNTLDGRVADSFSPVYSRQLTDVSYGRTGDGRWAYLAIPSPGAANPTTAVMGTTLADPATFSRPHGFYDRPISLELTTDIQNATIRFTVDASAPTSSSGEVYAGPIAISGTTVVRTIVCAPGYVPSQVETRSYIFPADVLRQSSRPSGFPETWGTYSVGFKEHRQGAPVAADYEMDPGIVDDPRWKADVLAGLTSLPTMSLGVAMQDFEDLYAHPTQQGVGWERPVSVEMIYPDGSPGFQLNAGMRIHGGVGRMEFMPKHSFRIVFKEKYGPATLENRLFPDSRLAEFDTLILRSDSDQSFAGIGRNRERATYLRDAWFRQSQIAMSGIGSHGLFVNLYINGLYWGLYDVAERLDESFFSSYLGGDEDDWLIANEEGLNHKDLSPPGEELLRTFLAMGQSGREGGLAADSEKAAHALRYLKPRVDQARFADFVVLNWYSGNEDWTIKNWYAAADGPEAPLRFLGWDGQETWFDGGAKVTLGTSGENRVNIVRPLFETLMFDDDFRMVLADRLYANLHDDGALTDARTIARWKALQDRVAPGIAAESARWGDTRNRVPITPLDWQRACSDVLKQMEGNADRLIALARNAGYYPAIDPPQFELREGGSPGAASLRMRSLDGDIYFTLDGTDPRHAGDGTVAPMASRYCGPLTLSGGTNVKARVFRGDTWSALREYRYGVAAQDIGGMVVSEIMYHPLGGDQYEFVELLNAGSGPLDLAAARFDEGVSFTFPAAMSALAPGERAVIVSGRDAFRERYPDVAVAGEFKGNLSNNGERITVKDYRGRVVASITYDDRGGWPISPDGGGDSLVLAANAADPDQPTSWRASTRFGGSPGQEE